jgi:hypothetical protein
MTIGSPGEPGVARDGAKLARAPRGSAHIHPTGGRGCVGCTP